MKYFKEEGKPVIKCWCDSPEDGAIEQAKNLASLPFLHSHIALMADTHQGYGMPIGGVIACDGYVIPNAVGVDIGCVDDATEYMSTTGWKKISSYTKGDDVLVFDSNTEETFFEIPKRYIKEEFEDNFIHFKNKYGVDQCLTPDHRCLVYKYDRDYTFTKKETVLAQTIYESHKELKNGYRHRFLTSFKAPSRKGVVWSEAILRVMVMVCADGSFSNRDIYSNRCTVNIRKQRKINRLRYLLEKADISYKEKDFLDEGVKTYRFTFTAPFREKCLSFYESNQEQLKVICDEVFNWDGNKKESCYYTRDKDSADFMNYAFSCCGYRSTIIEDIRESGLDYRVFAHNNIKIGINSAPKTEMNLVKGDGFKYCFTTSTSYWVMRRNGRIVVTGNCGMTAVKTSFKDEISEDTLKKIMGVTRRVVPMGMGKNHKDPCPVEAMPNIPHSDFVGKLINPARYQLGTLGSGNHFLEFQRDEENNLWIMIHSGSRKFGKSICDHYNKIARDLNKLYFSSVDDKQELAFLSMDTVEGMAYFEDMAYATDFAFRNRQKMMYETMEVVKNCILKYEGKKVAFDNLTEDGILNIPHNYASLERHYGKNVYVHRKGATRAYAGELGIIPGSQGSSSFIVEGLGNRESFMSCSHGAGRKMGRKAAQRDLDLANEIKNMEDRGIIHGMRSVKDLDEAMGAYKDIHTVMKEQEDLVSIKYKLRPIASLKG